MSNKIEKRRGCTCTGLRAFYLNEKEKSKKWRVLTEEEINLSSRK